MARAARRRIRASGSVTSTVRSGVPSGGGGGVAARVRPPAGATTGAGGTGVSIRRIRRSSSCNSHVIFFSTATVGGGATMGRALAQPATTTLSAMTEARIRDRFTGWFMRSVVSKLQAVERRTRDAILDNVDADTWTGRHRNGAVGTNDDFRVDQIRSEIPATGSHVARKREARQRRQMNIVRP